MDALKTNPTFKNIIPPLSNEEFDGLEQNILAAGKVRDPIVVWNGTIVDGHNRHKIATKHGLPYEVDSMEFEDEEAAKLWIIDNQLGRRNLPPYVRIELARLKESTIKAEAEKRMLAGKADPTQKSSEGSGETRQQVAAIAGVSHDTYKKAVEITENATPEAIQDLREGKKKINTVYREMRVGSKVCEVCGEEKPLSRFEREGSKKCLDCKAKKKANEPPVTDFSADEEIDIEYEIEDETAEIEESEEIPAQPSPAKLSPAEIAFGGINRVNETRTKEYEEDLQRIRESAKKMADHTRSNKRTIEEFKELFKANTENIISNMEDEIKHTSVHLWTDKKNKRIACALLDKVVGAISKLKEEFLT